MILLLTSILDFSQIGWGATSVVDDFVFDQAAERYALDEDVANKLQKANPGKCIVAFFLPSPMLVSNL